MATERYHPLFAIDLGVACSRYDFIESSLGNRFRENVRIAIRVIIERPESFGLIGGEFRGVLIDGFPYVVVFLTDSGGIAVLGLRHAASDRSSWFERTME